MPLSLMIHLGIMIIAFVCAAAAVFLVKRKAGERRVRQHRSAAITGAALMVSGVMVIAVFKTLKGFPHFASPHAVGGAVTVAVLLLTLLFGSLLLKGTTSLRPVHRFMGWTALTLTVLSLLSGILRIMELSA